MQLSFDADIEAFRAEFIAFLDQHLPDEADGIERPRSCSHVPEWAARWQRLLFDNGWLHLLALHKGRPAARYRPGLMWEAMAA